MRKIEERALAVRHGGMDVLHAEVTVEDGAACYYVQAHDNGNHRYYARSTQSWFDLQDGEEEEMDPIEEYSADPSDREEECAEPRFEDLLRPKARREEPYEGSEYVDVFVIADRLLDDLAEDLQEEEA